MHNTKSLELKDFGGGCPWRLAAVYFDLTFPGRERAEVTLAAPDREYLTLLIDSDAFEDNATPGFLLNTRTQKLLQLDRFYPLRAAFAHKGPQYYRPPPASRRSWSPNSGNGIPLRWASAWNGESPW